MPNVHCLALNKKIEVLSTETLMTGLLRASIPVASSCGGEGICKKCVITIDSNGACLSPPTELEKKTIDPQSSQRLSCQCFVLCDVEINTTYW